jgi:hypothetical protein
VPRNMTTAFSVLHNSNSRWSVSDPLPPSAALPLTRRGRIKLSRCKRKSLPREGETRAKRARGSLAHHLDFRIYFNTAFRRA